MPIFLDYDKNGKLLSTREEPLNPDNLSRYMLENTPERLAGYKDAIADLLQLLGPAIWTNYVPDKSAFFQPSSLRRSMLPLVSMFQEQTDFLAHLSTALDKGTAADSAKPM